MLIQIQQANLKNGAQRLPTGHPAMCDHDSFVDNLMRIIEATDRNEILLVCNVNLDDISSHNETHGYGFTTKAILQIEERLRSFVGHSGLISKARGGEYLLLLRPISSLDHIVPLLRALRDTVSTQNHVGDKRVCITGTVGCSIFPIEGNRGQMLIRNAAQAMYSAKLSGKNRYEIFDSQTAHIAAKEVQKGTVLQQAILNRELELHYQPKVDLYTGNIHSLEALVRWNHPVHGMQQPSAFLPQEYREGVGYQLGLWAIEAVMQQLEAWIQAGYVLPISVNISAGQFLNQSFLADLRRLQTEYPSAKPELIEFEILESEAIEDLERLGAIVVSLQAQGFKFSLDDFGTGYSSLLHLKAIPAQYVKVDKAFVAGITKNLRDHALLQMMIELSQLFNYEIVAEGVETLQHGQMLREMGCRYIQGYFISKPLPADLVIAWVKNYIPCHELAMVNELFPT
ncbi:putative bifunctional diguanylate cyclase/phosphodiesterase [Methylovorus glucosotrophus]|uniref:Diguanylate cyclase/phosphodiesterase n=1 Tax=Methylovorus glucosotrophus (strain SIP3-4) TaxID=582744 RepID=C6XEP3_METGS|nr:bifunctional diguanylate cyclase/phosphodiesterase [Methylovorus glucosotrophus]ACT52100.1 diguanylate cyclase/phosphodiesterase [Methylovorus glucosotrophus SIP3-4]